MGILDNGKELKNSSQQQATTVAAGDDPVVDQFKFVVQEDDTLWSKLDLYLPYLKYDTVAKFKKLETIAQFNGLPDIHTIKVGQTIIIPITASEKEKKDRMIPSALPSAAQEEKEVLSWSEKTGVPVQVMVGDKTRESEYKKQNHEGIQYFILHSDKKEGLIMNEMYSQDDALDDGKMNKKEIAQQDFSKVPLTIVNGCESDENLDGFLMGGSQRAFGYFYKIEDTLASQVGPSMLQNGYNADAETMHQYTRNKMKMLRDQGYGIKYWSSLIDKYQEFSTEEYGTLDQFDFKKEGMEASKEKDKQIRKDARGDKLLKADRKELAHLNKEIRKKHKELKKDPESPSLQSDLEILHKQKEEQRKQLYLQSMVKGEAGEEKSEQVQRILKDGEAVVEIKEMKGKSLVKDGVEEQEPSEYMALVNLPNKSGGPKAIYLGESTLLNKRASHQTNTVNFNMSFGEDNERNFSALWGKVDAYLAEHDIKKIYYKSDGLYSRFSLHNLYSKGQYLLDKLDIQYLY
ncbi:MAG: LysM peptidoglycan-binding domain-containing protein [Cytophagaceae bacterium]|nr:LysM peptidoglycan-binding domain-containing protein [Cytophagaceae bacterium]